ncbi:hypothetical protein QYE76_042059 [Lolium multiflorum]|uniref:Aminotransferase-like plant mobile domain-containing protein n=1 Tax=Lolium multiflorum TaxID=4521 RepID=A0AAD8WWL3_LOLMU|nr:hypothetical protein QYE76_042059 [Lolium multiflorum]
MMSDPKIMYRHYTEELDTLTAEQVNWEPYGTYYHIGAGMADLNPKCVEEARFWRMRCPLICMWLVEYHQPHRVMRQFGLYQECPPQWQDTDHTLHRLDRQRQRKITNWPVHHRGHVTAFQHCLEAVRNAGHVEIVPHDLAAFNNYLQWFHQSTCIELVKPAYDDQILDNLIEFDEVAQSQHDIYARRGRSTSIASELNFVRSEIQNTAEECENTARKMRRLANLLGCRDTEITATSSSEDAEIPDDDTILSQGIVSQRKKQATRQLKPRGKAPKRYTPDDYVNRGKKVVIQEDETPPRRSTLRKMRNDEPLSSEEEQEQEQEEQHQQEPRQRTKRLAVRKQPVRRGRLDLNPQGYFHNFSVAWYKSEPHGKKNPSRLAPPPPPASPPARRPPRSPPCAPAPAPVLVAAAASSRGASAHQLPQSLASSSRLELYPGRGASARGRRRRWKCVHAGAAQRRQPAEAWARGSAAAGRGANTRERRRHSQRRRLGAAAELGWLHTCPPSICGESLASGASSRCRAWTARVPSSGGSAGGALPIL